MKSKIQFAAVSLVILVVASCKKPVSPLAEFIPKNAAAVFSVDLKAITTKLSSSGITIDSLANLFSDRNDEDALHWSDIKNSGIDLDVPFFIFSNQASSIQGGNTTSSGLVAQIKDKNKLIVFLKKQSPGAEVTADTKYQYINLKDGSVAGWTDKVLIISNVNNQETLSHQQLTTLFTQNESASIASLGEFRDMLKKPGDMHFWVNASANMGSLGMLGMTKLSTLFQDTYTEGTIDFANGKAIVSAESHYNKTLSDILSKYPSREIDKNLISRYPGPVNGFAIVAFDPKVLIDILHYLGFDTMSDNYLSQMGFTTSDVMNAFKGDIAVIFSDFKMEEQNFPGMQAAKPGGQFLLNATIGDKEAFNRVMASLVKQRILSQDGNRYELGMFGGHDFIIETNNDNFLIASNDNLLKAYQSAGGKSALSPEVEKEIANKSMAAYFDIAGMLQKSSSGDSAAMKTVEAARSTFKNFIAFTEKGDGKTTKSRLELNTVNSSENSLASIARFIAIAHEEGMKHRNNFEIHPPFGTDSIPGMPNVPEEKDTE